MKIIEPSATLLWITPEPLLEIERAGRTCYKSEDKITEGSARQFVRMIKQRGHESVVEHGVASFRIVCDRGVSHEIVRHRIASYSQESTRYCNYTKEKFGSEISVIKPPDIHRCWPAETSIAGGEKVVDGRCVCAQCEVYRTWEAGVLAAEASYAAMTSRKVSPQIARSVLPTCLKTEMVMTANFREWNHFIDLRTSPAAHPQIRPIAESVWEQLHARVPEVFEKPDHSPKIRLSRDEADALKHLFALIGPAGSDSGIEFNPTIMAALRSAQEKIK